VKVLIKAGTHGWIFQNSLNGPTAFTFRQDTTVDVERTHRYWYKVTAAIPDFPEAPPDLLINEIHIPEIAGK
jgi:hypothetical protein